MIENHAGGEDCPNCGLTKPKGFECPWCAIKTLEADCLRLSDRIRELEGDSVDFLKTHRKRLADLEFDLSVSAQANDRYRAALESMHKNITVVKHWAPYTICRDSWLVMIEDALKDDA